MTDIRLHNSASRQKEAFAPIDPSKVRMYVCGPTVYDRAHIGNARPVVVFDVLFRLLRHIYGEAHVNYVRNITDIDDKINARAKETLEPGKRRWRRSGGSPILPRNGMSMTWPRSVAFRRPISRALRISSAR